jgi:hypothetical protein
MADRPSGGFWTSATGYDIRWSEGMPDTVTINSGTAIDKYGKRTYGGSSQTIQARVIMDTQLIKDTEGQDIVSVGRAILAGPYSSIGLGDKITLPDGKTPVIVKVNTVSDSAGPVYTAVYFGI